MITEECNYAIVSHDGVFVTAPSEEGSGRFISLMPKNLAQLNMQMYYPKGYKIKKMRV